MNEQESDQVVILMVEDNAADVAFFREALKYSGVAASVNVVDDGDGAMQFLRRTRSFADAPRPHMVVLDLNLPGKNGREVLADMASDPGLNTIPVAVLTSSTYEADVCGIYPAGRCQYFVKTGDFNELVVIIRKISNFALSVNLLFE